MIDRKLFQKTFSTLHASPDTLSEVYKVVQRKKRRHTLTKGMLVAAVLAMCITVAGAVGIATLIKADVAPADSVTDADLSAFGADSIGSDTPIVTDNSGQVLNLPKMERVAVDAGTMQRLVGDYLSTVDAVMEVDGYTIKLNTFLIDENGSGFLTYTLSHPDGVDYRDVGYGKVDTAKDPVLFVGYVGSDHHMDTEVYLDAAASTDTELHLVVYFSDFGFWNRGDDLVFAVAGQSGGDWGGIISITPRTYLPATTFTAESGDTVTVSALGIRMPNPAAATGNVTDAVSDELVLHMADGSQYVVESEKDNIMNWVVGLCIADKDYHIIGSAYSFNRMVDVDAVTSATFGGHYYTDLTAETATTFNYTSTR